MKYKAKISLAGSGIIHSLVEGSTHTNDNYEGVIAFIPFTDQRFFEPVKTRTFQVEVPENQMGLFEAYVLQHDDRWTVIEITELEYLVKLKANREVAPQVIEIMSDNENLVATHSMFLISLNEHGRNNRLSVVKDIKTLLYDRFPSIAGLKNAKDIVDSWWNL